MEVWRVSRNKLHTTCPKLKYCISCPRTNRREETVISRLHISHSYMTPTTLLKGDEPSLCIPCDDLLTIEYILLFCSDLIEARERPFRSLRMFEDVYLDCLFDCLKKITFLWLPFWLPLPTFKKNKKKAGVQVLTRVYFFYFCCIRRKS